MPSHIKRETDTRTNRLEEGYWRALLTEGENARTFNPDDTNSSNNYFSDDNPVKNPAEITTEYYYEDEDWNTVQHIMDSDDVLNLDVVGFNRGGLLVEWRSLRGFVPASQLVDFPAIHDDDERRKMLETHVGQRLHLRVIELNPEKNRLILSERAAQVESGIRHELLHNLHTGDSTHGFITNLCDFGAFVDLGGVEGLIHISELSWGRVNHPADLLERGQRVRVYVMEVDEDDARVALSIKRLKPDPWANAERKYYIGQRVEGEITNVVDFGAFVCLEEGLEGLIHYSELAEGHFLHPRNVVSEGDMVQVRILTINSRDRRMGLSLRPNEDQA